MVIATLLGVPAGIAAARGSMPIRGAIIVAMTAPILVPVVSQGVSYYALFARLGLIDTYAGLVIAHAALAIPVVVMNAWAAARQVDATLEDAARSLGASFGRSYFYVTLPLIRHGIVAGGILAFMTSFDESVLSLFLAGSHVATIPKRMWDGLQFALDPTVSAVGVLLVSLAALTIGTVFCYARIVE
jgi:putative spermidine/putrescine transport system permease protein